MKDSASTFHGVVRGNSSACLSENELRRFSFSVPACLGEEEPSREACCELFDPLNPVKDSVLGSYKKLIVAGAMKSGTSALFKYL